MPRSYILGVLLAVSACDNAPIRIVSLLPPSGTGTSLLLTVQLADDGSKGDLFLGATAISNDDHALTTLFQPTKVLHLPDHSAWAGTVVIAPGDPRAFSSERLLIQLFSSDGTVVAEKPLDFKYNWPDRVKEEMKQIPMSLDNESGFVSYLRMRLDDGDFSTVELFLTKFGRSDVREPTGELPSTDFYRALDAEMDFHPLKEYKAMVARWRAAYPRSQGAAIAEARGWCRLASGPHYGAPASEIDGRWKIASDLLDASKAFGPVLPAWYQAKLEIMNATFDDDGAQAVFDEAIKTYPNIPALYVLMGVHWVPGDRGYAGDWSKLHDVVALAASRIGGGEGAAQYANVVSQIGYWLSDPSDLLSTETVPWPRLKTGFTELLKRYPTKINLNRYAVFACAANDRSAFVGAWIQLGPAKDAGGWPSNYSYDLCEHRFMGTS